MIMYSTGERCVFLPVLPGGVANGIWSSQSGAAVLLRLTSWLDNSACVLQAIHAHIWADTIGWNWWYVCVCLCLCLCCVLFLLYIFCNNVKSLYFYFWSITVSTYWPEAFVLLVDFIDSVVISFVLWLQLTSDTRKSVQTTSLSSIRGRSHAHSLMLTGWFLFCCQSTCWSPIFCWWTCSLQCLGKKLHLQHWSNIRCLPICFKTMILYGLSCYYELANVTWNMSGYNWKMLDC